MTTTTTAVGLDVHVLSTEAAALHLPSRELRRQRFGPGVEQVVAWLGELDQPLHACYEAGLTGFGLYRAAREEAAALERPDSGEHARWSGRVGWTPVKSRPAQRIGSVPVLVRVRR